MQFAVEVGGSKEHSRIEVHRDPITGSLRIMADGKTVAERSPLSPFTHFSLQTVHRYAFAVGHAHQHNVVVEHERPLFFAGFRAHRYRVFVDGELVHEQRGY